MVLHTFSLNPPKNIMVTSIDIEDRIKIYNSVNEVKHSVYEMRETYAGSKYKSW